MPVFDEVKCGVVNFPAHTEVIGIYYDAYFAQVLTLSDLFCLWGLSRVIGDFGP